jgi:hypothetical protein
MPWSPEITTATYQTRIPDWSSIYYCIQASVLDTNKKNCCLWDRVTCDLQTGYLVGLDLSINSIASGISGSSSLFSLTGDEWQLWEEEKRKLSTDGKMIKAWGQDVCSLCGFRFESCVCLYDGHWRLTWSLTSGPMKLIKVRANWPEHLR